MLSDNTKKYRKFRLARILTALVLLILITLSFTFLGKQFHYVNQVLHLQFVPSLVAFVGGGVVALIFFLLLTLVFGRVYCSWICPLGVYQDVVSRIAGVFKSKKGRQYKWHRPLNVLRYSILGVVLAFLVVGISYPFAYLDPYSNWGRIVRGIFSPLLQMITNLLSKVFPDSVYYRPLAPIVLGSFLLMASFFVLVTVMSALRGRLYCNSVCPVGTFLGALSRISFFRPAIDKDMCVACGQCAKHCKSECIDLEHKRIDQSRCVMCFDCMSACSRGGVSLVPRWGHVKELPKEDKKLEIKGRREAIVAMGSVAAFVAVRQWKSDRLMANEEHDFIPDVARVGGIIPPGGGGVAHLIENCTACHACISACPNNIISMATGEYGINGMFLPVIHYDKAFCGYNCRQCMDVCPNGALADVPLEQKQLIKIGQAKFTLENCVVFKAHTDCGACDEHCPTKAITMQDAEDGSGLRFPHIDAHYCIGCGGCEYICPATPKAMKVIPLKRHLTALPPKKEEQQQKDVEDFGF